MTGACGPNNLGGSATKELPHLALAVLMNQAWSVEELLICCVLATLSARLLDRGDDVVWSVATKLPSFRSHRPVDIVPVAIIMAPVAVIMASFFAEVVIAT